MSNEYKPTYVDNTDNSISIMESTDTISFCKTGTKINTLSAKNVAHKKSGENLNLCAYDGSSFKSVLTINNQHNDCRIMTNLNVSGNLNIIGNGIINTSLGIGTTSLNNGFTSSNVHTNSILDINGQTTIRGHILPSQNAQFDLGSAEYKIRHLYLSSNSLWIGDKHKIDVSDGTIKFRKRKTKTIPTSIDAIKGGDDDAAIQTWVKNEFEHGSLPAISAIKLEEWHAYAQSKQANIKIEDIFKPDIEGDWDENDTTMDKLVIKNNIDISGNLNMSSTGCINLPVGTNTERPSHPNVGGLRYNTEYGGLELYNGLYWLSIPVYHIRGDLSLGWEVIMSTNQSKFDYTHTTLSKNETAFGSPGTAAWSSCSLSSTGAETRDKIKTGSAYLGSGLYKAFFTKKFITKIALVDDSTDSMNPYDHTKYVIFDLTVSEPQGTGPESINEILKRLNLENLSTTSMNTAGKILRSNAPATTTFTGGDYGYSGKKIAHKGDWNNCDFFCIWGYSHASDLDQAILCIYNGNLGDTDASAGGQGKYHDRWRQNYNAGAQDTLWSYWGSDAYAVPSSHTISKSKNGDPGHIFNHPSIDYYYPNGHNPTQTSPDPQPASDTTKLFLLAF